MHETKRTADFALKRSQALRNMESHLQSILFGAAKSIISASNKYTIAGSLIAEASLLSEAKKITSRTAADIEKYISAYSKAACKILDIGTDNIDSFLVGDIFGKTIRERNDVYLANFAEDIVRMVKAGALMGYSDSQILSAVRTGYKNPYLTSVITKARKKDINIATPSYGSGYYHNAYSNLLRNASQTISMAWGLAEQEYGKDSGAIGFEVHRGSSYPCDICDSMTGYVHKWGDPFPPFHVSCVCYTSFVYKNKEK